MKTSYWDWQHDGTHFCSECGTNALYKYISDYNNEVEEVCSNYCPKCGCYMTHIENPTNAEVKTNE